MEENCILLVVDKESECWKPIKTMDWRFFCMKLAIELSEIFRHPWCEFSTVIYSYSVKFFISLTPDLTCSKIIFQRNHCTSDWRHEGESWQRWGITLRCYVGCASKLTIFWPFIQLLHKVHKINAHICCTESR